MMDYLGGRKFVMGLIMVTAGVVIEIYGKNGLSTNMVALLGAVYATFNAANALVTSRTANAASQPVEPTEASSAPVVEAPPEATQASVEAKLVPIVQAIAAELGKINENQSRQERALQIVQEAQLATQKVILARQG